MESLPLRHNLNQARNFVSRKCDPKHYVPTLQLRYT
jgi:hypothetical protein